MKQFIVVRNYILAFILAFCVGSNALNAQSKSASETLLKKAELAYQEAKYAVAANFYETYLQNPLSKSSEAMPKLADCYWQMRDYGNALRTYQIIYPLPHKCTNKQDLLRMSELFARSEQYAKAAECLMPYPEYRSKAQTYQNPKALNTMRYDSISWTLGFSNINTTYREFSPFVANNTLLFSSNKPLQTKTQAFGWDNKNYSQLWSIPIEDLKSVPLTEINPIFRKKPTQETLNYKQVNAFELGDNKKNSNLLHQTLPTTYLNGDNNPIGKIVEGLKDLQFNAGAVSVDKNNDIYFSANYNEANTAGVNRIRLMQGHYTSVGISDIKPLPFGDPNTYSVMHPAVNREGTLLVFSCDKNDGQGGFDLYYSQRKNTTEPWGSLTPFARNINTLGNEVFPYISPDNMLYFSSDMMPGLGGLDIYSIKLDDALAGNEIPEHISYPINSSSDDFGWTQTDNAGKKGFFTSDRINSDDNIFTFSFKKVLRRSYLEGLVVNRKTLEPIPGATVFLYNEVEDLVYISKADAKGRYLFYIFSPSNAVLKATDKMFNDDDCLATRVSHDPNQEIDVTQKAYRNLELDVYRVGHKWKLDNIYYDFNKYNIRGDASPTLDSLIKILNMQPIMVELGSHTDSRGTFKYNERLSDRRARSAAEYLIKRGIDSTRITYKGYGEYQLINRCADKVKCSEAAHQANRRTEVKVTGYTIPQNKPNEIDPDKYYDGQTIKKEELPSNFFENCK